MKKTKAIKALLVKNTSSFKEVREADKIISYLKDRGEKSSLPVNLKKKLDRYYFINQLRMRYKQRDYIIGHLLEFHNRNPRQAGHDIAEAEYIFGKAIRVDRQYELSFLIQLSIKSIELAMASKDVKLITMALKMHYELLGPEVDESDVPDASKFEQHIYNMILPPSIADAMKTMISEGAIDLSKMIPPKMLNISAK